MSVINKIYPVLVDEFNKTQNMNIYQEAASGSAIYPGKGEPLGLMYCALKLNGEAGELAEHVGKAMRDDGYGDAVDKLTESRRELIIKELGDCLWYLSAICNELKIDFSWPAEANLEKLMDRQERGVLQGSGDNR